jgi:hypothetical protein
VSLPTASSGLDASFPNEVVHSFGSKISVLQQSQEPNWQMFQDYAQVTGNGTVRKLTRNQKLGLGGVGLEQGQSCCNSGFCSENNTGRFQAVRIDNVRGQNSSSVKEEGHDWLPEQGSDELLSMVFKQVRS